MEHVLSTLSLVASVLYCGIGCYAYAQNRQSILHKKFLHLSILMTIWAFFYMFAYLATTNAKFVLFNNIAAIGWCLFPAAVLSFCLTLGNYQSIKSSIVTMLLYVPGICFFLFAIYGFSGDKTQRLLMYQVFNIGNFLYNFLYLVGAMVLIYLWGKRAAKAHEKKQAAIILYAALIPFLLQLLLDIILPSQGIYQSLNAGHLYAMIMYLGIYYAIVKYHFLKIPSERINHELFEYMMDLALIADSEGLIIRVNKKFQDLLGYDASQVVGQPLTSVLPLSWNEIFVSFTQKRAEFVNLWISTSKQTLIPMRLTITKIYDDQSQDINGYLLLGQDNRLIHSLKHEIDQHKETMEELKRSEVLMQTVVNMTPFAIILTKVADNRILFANRKAEQMFQQPVETIIGFDANHYYKAGVREEMKQVLLQGKTIDEREVEFIRENKSSFYGLITMRKGTYQKEEVLVSCINDITEQRILLQNIAKSEELLRTVMNAISDVVLMTDLDGNITYGNQSAHEIFGFSRNLPSNIEELFGANQKLHLAAIHGEESGHYEFTYLSKQGLSMDFEIYRNVLVDEMGVVEGIIYVMRNITDRNIAREKLEQSKVEIEAMYSKLQNTNHMLLEKAIRDGLTNLYNHQHINQLLEQEMQRCKENGEPLCLMMLDIDYFKRVNDTYGHQFGDHVLVTLAEIMRTSIRSIDLPGRYGGEEFIIVLPQVTIQEAVQIAERIRRRVETHLFEEHQMYVTISIGVSDMIFDLDDAKRLVNKADTMLYMAKENGRNRIESSHHADQLVLS